LLIRQALPYSPDSAHWLLRVRDLGRAVWLDSAHPHSRRGRYDIISAAPLESLRAPAAGADPFAQVQRRLRERLPPLPASELPFSGGAIGLFGYELGRRQLRLAAGPAPLFPDLLVGLYSWAVVSDHRQRQTWLVARPETAPQLLAELRHRLTAATAPAPAPFRLDAAWSEDFDAAAYRRAFERLQRYIDAGDCYQVNLARRFRAAASGDPLAAYLQLRAQAAAPFSAYLEDVGETDSGGGAVLCFSPERLLAAQDGALLTQPIKGTAPRAADPTEDRVLGEALLASPKNRAENLMIVDLLRNDLGRSCATGSVVVERLFELQSFATVHHLVSTIRGRLRPELHPLDALRHCFPGGSITGAPKLRAMQIIDELEPQPRAVFCGAIGYIDASGRMDTNITIRTLLARQGELYAWAGGGIVADSDCEAEFAETENKIMPLLRALESDHRS
jgi:para-aminobenzoate synthetase component 1